MDLPRIFLIANYRERASEVWLHRVRAALGSSICGEAYFDVGHPASTSIVRLMPTWWAAVVRIGLANDMKFATPRKGLLQEAIVRSEANIVYCHFANLAVRLQSVWDHIALPIAVHCHGFDVSFDLLHAGGRPRYRNGYVQQIIELSQRANLIANSDYTRRNLLDHGISERRISTWHFGVPASEQQSFRSPSIDQILYLGRFIGCKGPVETLQAYALARGRGLTAKMVMAGDGSLLADCRNLVNELGLQNSVSFSGAVNADVVNDLLSRSQVFTAHTRKDPATNQCEAFGVAFAEALGAGLPVVTGRHAGPASFLTHERDSLLFEPGNIEAHAESLLRVAADPDLRSRLSDGARATAAEKFDLHRQHAALLQLLSRFAGES